MVQVVWTGPAAIDLQEVHDFIARASPHYAMRTVEKIVRAADGLARTPQIGGILPEFPTRQYRQILIGNYRLIYREDVAGARILIIGVIHASRDLPRRLDPR